MERLQRLIDCIKRVGKFDMVQAMDVGGDRTLIEVWHGADRATFDMPTSAIDVAISSAILDSAETGLLEILVENRLAGLREWAYWERVEQEYLREHPETT